MQQIVGQATEWMNLLLGHRESLDAVSQSASAALLSALWQGALIAAGLSIFVRLAPRMTAAHQFAVWAVGFASLMLLPLLPLFPITSHWAGTQPSINTSAISSFAQKPLLLIDSRWGLAIAALWLAASLYRAADLAYHSLSLRRLWKAARPVAMDFGYAGSLKLAGRKAVELCSTEELQRPSVIGFFAPRILIPDWLLARLTPSELDQIVLHEVEHLRRGDDWTNLLQKLGLVLFPLNPALFWIERHLCREREMACDEAVVRITNAPRAYAACLASLAERSLNHRMQAVSAGTLSLGAWQRRPELARRVHSILLRKRFLGPLGAWGLIAAVSCGLAVASIQLERCPALVAFVPTQQEAARRLARGLPDRMDVPRTTMQTGGAYMTQLKAVMPERETAPSPSHPIKRPAPSATLASAFPAIPAPVAPQQQPEVAATQEHWLVLTTWEQIDTAPGAPQTDYAQADSAENGNLPGSPSHQPSQHRVAVTRLIFRMLPSANSGTNSVPAPPMVSIRGGWIVFQL
jgi:beta-lactamase regulating signal transducer with metallopeptidase domain